MAAVDASVKQIETDLSSIPNDIDSLFSTNRGLLKDIVPLYGGGGAASASSSGRLPQSIADFETFLSQLTGHLQQSQRKLNTKKQEMATIKSNIAANDALLSSHRERINLIQPKLRLIAEKEQELRSAITSLNELRSGPVLNDSSLDPIDFSASLEEIVQAGKLTEDEARELMIIAKAGKGFMKRLKKIRQKNPNQCPCCGQGMTDPRIVQSFEERTKALFSLMEDNNGNNNGEPTSVEEHKEVLTKCSEVNAKIQSLQSIMLPLLQSKSEIIGIENSMKLLLEEKDRYQQNDLPQLQHDVDQYEDDVNQLQLVQRSCEDLVSKWSSLEHKKQEFLHKRKRLSQSFLSMSSSSSSMSYDLTTG